jgi:hypothetical protein
MNARSISNLLQPEVIVGEPYSAFRMGFSFTSIYRPLLMAQSPLSAELGG